MDKRFNSSVRMHADRDEVQAGIPLLLTMLAAGVLAALTARMLLTSGPIEWIAMIGVFAVAAHLTGILYSLIYSKLRGENA